jgi:hypothetical protein
MVNAPELVEARAVDHMAVTADVGPQLTSTGEKRPSLVAVHLEHLDTVAG